MLKTLSITLLITFSTLSFAQAADRYVNVPPSYSCYKLSADGKNIEGTPVAAQKCVYTIVQAKCYSVDSEGKPWAPAVDFMFCAAQ